MDAPKDYEIAWLRELARRTEANLPRSNRDLMVALREILPQGFTPSQLNGYYVHGDQPSIEGLLAIGDTDRVVPDVERAIIAIRDRLVADPQLAAVSSEEISRLLGVSTARAESLLRLLSSLGHFSSGAIGGANGYSSISLSSDESMAEYLAFVSVSKTLADRSRLRMRAATAPHRDPYAVDASAAVVRNSVFIVMGMDPLDDSLIDVHQTIRSVCAGFGLTASRIDEIEHQDQITDQILTSIASADFIVADLSGERPNVYYEVGYAHALGKRPILIRKAGTHLHFDLVVHKVPEYRNITELRLLLDKRFEAVLGRMAQQPVRLL